LQRGGDAGQTAAPSGTTAIQVTAELPDRPRKHKGGRDVVCVIVLHGVAIRVEIIV
jgi:hypothetical protein